MSDGAPIPKDILGVPLEVGDCVAIAGATRGGKLLVGNIREIRNTERYGYYNPYVFIVTQAGRTTVRSPGEVAFISRNPRGP